MRQQKHIEPLEQVIDGLNLEIKRRHINRLRKGRCTIETGLILEDIMTNFERVSDHCSNIAVCMIEVRDNGFETHGYLEHLTNEDNPQFAKECRQYYKQYQLPELKKLTRTGDENMALIYIVEDDESIREIETIALKNSGHMVGAFGSSKEFFKKLDEILPDLVLLDVMLPDESGYDIIKS